MCNIIQIVGAKKPKARSDPGEAKVAIEFEHCMVPVPGESDPRDLLQPLTDQVTYMMNRLKNACSRIAHLPSCQ